MQQRQYVNVSEFIQNSEVLRRDGNYYIHEDLFAYAYPVGDRIEVTYYGNPERVGASTTEQVNDWLSTLSGNRLKKIGTISGTLVTLKDTGEIDFCRFDPMGEIDTGYIESIFGDITSLDSVHTFDYGKSEDSNEQAIFVDTQGKPVFLNVDYPYNIEEYVDGKFIEEVALSTDGSFCFRFSDGQLFYYNGNELSDTSYELIPTDIASFANYDIEGFENGPRVSPNEIGKIRSVVANNGFAVLNDMGRVIVWGGVFQPINDNHPNYIRPTIIQHQEEIHLGESFGVCRSSTGTITAWGINNSNIITDIRVHPDPVENVIVSDKVMLYTHGRGGEVGVIPANTVDDDTFTSAVGGEIGVDVLNALGYSKVLMTLNSSDYALLYREHINESFDPVRIEFKMVQHQGEYYIPLSDYFNFDLVGIKMEVFNSTRRGGSTLGKNIRFGIDESYTSVSGNPDMSKVVVSPLDANRNGVPDDPFAFKYIVGDDDQIIMETFIDTDSTESTRVSRSVRLLSDSSFLSPGQVYYADVNKTIKDIFQEEHTYEIGTFYRGEVSDDGIILNRAEALPEGFDEVSGKRFTIMNGRGFSSTDPFMFQWNHFSTDGGDLIDPSISNIMDMYILTTSYDLAVRRWLRSNGDLSDMPKPPTSEELRTMIRFIENNKSTSDQIIYIPARYKLLFGSSAVPEHQAVFNVVKASGATMSDNEIKSRVINAINDYFDIENWDFGERFYFSELSAHIHNSLIGEVASVVIVPRFRDASFGDLYQIKSEPNELFLSTASVDDVTINPHYTDKNMRKR